MRYLIAMVSVLGGIAGVDAQEIRGGYVGLALGSFNYDDTGENLGLPISDTSTAYRIIGGYQFNSFYAIEASYGVSGQFEEHFAAFQPDVGNLFLDIVGEYEIATLRFLALAPFSSINVYGGGGYYDATLDAEYRFRTPLGNQTDTSESSADGLTAVGGVQWDLRRMTIRGEYEWFDTDDGVDASSLSIVAIFRF